VKRELSAVSAELSANAGLPLWDRPPGLSWTGREAGPTDRRALDRADGCIGFSTE
jgi:hypothetical protein